MQIIFHIDLNAFFANAEITIHPEFKGKPLVVCRNSKRSIITTASYEARKFGIHSAMPLFQAKERCSQLVIVEPHFHLYRKLSNEFFDIIKKYSSYIEIASIDECYVDMTSYIIKNNIDPYLLAKRIQNDILNSLSLQCSVGIAPNKFLAKMASDMKKPMGVTIINNQNYKEKLWHLPISHMYGIGKKTAPKLNSVGIMTIGDLAKYSNLDIIKQFLGKNAIIYYQRANGKDYSKVNYHETELKSVGNSKTLEDDTNDLFIIKSTLKQLSYEVSNRAINRNLVSNTISITLKYNREKQKNKQMIIDSFTNDFDKIYSIALIIFESLYNGEKIRLIGVTLQNVINKADIHEQISLFEKNIKNNKKDTISDLISDLNSKLNEPMLKKASSLIKKPQQNKNHLE